MSTACTCGHSEEDHYGSKEYPGSTACHGDMEDGPCDCTAYECDEDDE